MYYMLLLALAPSHHRRHSLRRRVRPQRPRPIFCSAMAALRDCCYDCVVRQRESAGAATLLHAATVSAHTSTIIYPNNQQPSMAPRPRPTPSPAPPSTPGPVQSQVMTEEMEAVSLPAAIGQRQIIQKTLQTWAHQARCRRVRSRPTWYVLVFRPLVRQRHLGDAYSSSCNF